MPVNALKLAYMLGVLLLSCAAIGGQKQRDWQTGKVVDSGHERHYAGTVGHANTAGTMQSNNTNSTYHGNANSNEVAIYRNYLTFSFETDKYLYEARQHVRKFTKHANLTVNGPVKFAVEKSTVYVIDDGGTEHVMELMKRVLKEPKQ